MSAEADWALLSIAPTQERRAIRTAYAQRLKAIDPESDPQAFIRLRNAYERALSGLLDPNAAPAPGERDPLALAEAPQSDAMLEEADAAEGHARAILGLLWGNNSDKPWLEPEARQELIAHWRAVISDPRMEQLDHADRVERWASAVIAGASPLSEPILMSAAERFGWIDADQDVHSSHQVFEIARRYRLLKLLDSASRPGSRHHTAWVELHRPAGESYSKPIHPYLVFELIAAMRYAHPQLGESFDSGRLATWELHAEDARTAHERIDDLPAPPRGALMLTLIIVLVLALGASFFFAWIHPE